MVLKSPWDGEVPLTKDHFLHRCIGAGIWVLPHRPCRSQGSGQCGAMDPVWSRGSNVGPWIQCGAVDPVWGRRYGVSAVCGTPGARAERGKGVFAPSPCQSHGAALQEPLGSQAQWKYNGIIDGPLLLGLI